MAKILGHEQIWGIFRVCPVPRALRSHTCHNCAWSRQHLHVLRPADVTYARHTGHDRSSRVGSANISYRDPARCVTCGNIKRRTPFREPSRHFLAGKACQCWCFTFHICGACTCLLAPGTTTEPLSPFAFPLFAFTSPSPQFRRNRITSATILPQSHTMLPHIRHL